MTVEARFDSLRRQLSDGALDAFIVHRNSDLRWLTGLSGMFDDENAHFALITDKVALFHTDSRYINAFEARRAAGEASGWTFSAEAEKHVSFLARKLKEIFGISRKLRIGIEADISLSSFRELTKAFEEASLSFELVEAADLILKLRGVKDLSEIACCKHAQGITDTAFSHMCGWMREGMTEAEIALELDFTLRRLGACALAFPSIIASGENGASPHSLPGSKRIVKGDMIVMDFGAKYDDYCSDMTRTVCVGEPSKHQREVFDVVLTAQTAAEKALSRGAIASDIHTIAAKIIENAGYGAYFGHGLGHGVGIDIHELPILNPFSDIMLESGSIVTVEPGIYLPREFGVRIEDFGVVTDDGFEVFTASSHELFIIES